MLRVPSEEKLPNLLQDKDIGWNISLWHDCCFTVKHVTFWYGTILGSFVTRLHGATVKPCTDSERRRLKTSELRLHSGSRVRAAQAGRARCARMMSSTASSVTTV